jgi:hypothetical protein
MIKRANSLKVVDFIKTIRESFGASIAVYRFGNCYQFYEILKSVFPEAEAFYDGNHVWTKIDGKFYDILGESNLFNRRRTPVTDDMIGSLSKNKMFDEERGPSPMEILIKNVESL